MKSKYFYLLLAFIFWFLPFLYRMSFSNHIVLDSKKVQSEQMLKKTEKKPKKSNSITSKIAIALDQHDNFKAFNLIFKNNLRGCIINIVGGFLLGLATILNLSVNGFCSSDVFVSVYYSGFGMKNILRTTLPHSFELMGFWLSGAIGLAIAWSIIQFIRGKGEFSIAFYKKVVFWSIVVFLIILCAAYVEAYISVKMLK